MTSLRIVTLVRLVQFSNAKPPMLVTPPGIVALVRPLQYLNAVYPMRVTLVGIVMLVRVHLP